MIPRGAWAATTEFKLNLLAPVTQGVLDARAHIVSLTKRTAVVRIDVDNDFAARQPALAGAVDVGVADLPEAQVAADVDMGFMRWLTVCVPGDARQILLETPGAPALDAKTADLIVTTEGLMFVSDWNAGMHVLEYKG